MGIVLDLIILAIIGLCAFFAAKKGFVSTLLECVGFILAIILAVNLAGPIAAFTYDSAIKPSVVDSITESVESASDDVFSNMPGFVTSMLESAGVNKDAVMADVDESAEEAAIRISDSVVKPSAVSILKLVFTIPLFFILLILVKFLAKILNSLFKGVVLGNLNKILGGVLGGAKGILYSIIFAFAALFIATLFSDGFLIFSRDAISGSFICKFILSLFSINI